jgi:anti-anti-sigma factor
VTLQTLDESELEQIPQGAHVGWVVTDSTTYTRVARAILAQGAELGEKLVAFGPEGSDALVDLTPDVAIAADPRIAFLDGDRLDPDRMFAMFHEQVDLAREEGFTGLRLVADMDWLLSASPTASDVVAFELLLDRVVGELGATVVCAYRTSSFPSETVTGTLAVHPVVSGSEEPQFRLVAGDSDAWELSGEVDIGVADSFGAAIRAAAGSGGCIVDVGGLEFIDVASVRTLAEACATGGEAVRLRKVSPSLRRLWALGSFDEVGPLREID